MARALKDLFNGLTQEEMFSHIKNALASGVITQDEFEDFYKTFKDAELNERYNQISLYKPHPFQLRIMNAGKKYRYRMLCAGNRCGKSFTGAQEVALHATGLYNLIPGYDGFRIKQSNPLIWCIGLTTETTKSILQYELTGLKSFKGDNQPDLGSRAIPRQYIIPGSVVKDGDRCLSFKVQHHNSKGIPDGEATIVFKSYAQGMETFFGEDVSFIWCDENVKTGDLDFYNQFITRLRVCKGALLLTLTPEWGATDLIKKMRENPSKQDFFMMAGIDDALHFTPEDREEMINEYPEYQRQMRLYGIPDVSEGAIFDIPIDPIVIDNFEIPDNWPQVICMDLGWTHETTACLVAFNPNSGDGKYFDCYVVAEYGAAKTMPEIHAIAVNSMTDFDCPVILPHDGFFTNREGEQWIEVYKRAGLENIQNDQFNNGIISHTGKTNNDVWPGLMVVRSRIIKGQLKIFRTCVKTIKQIKQYRTDKTGAIYKYDDDYVDALRMAVNSQHRARARGYNKKPRIRNEWNNDI